MKRGVILALIAAVCCLVGTRQTVARTQQTQATAMQSVGQQGQTPTQAGTAPGANPPMPPRKVAITFDDLPAADASRMTGAEIDEMTAKILAQLKKQNIPATAFVNEVKLYKWGEVDERIKALEMWLDDGFELGNHTYSHVSLNKVGLQAWEENIVEGEPVLKLLLAQHGMTLRYFRYPFLDSGADLLTRRQAEQFLAARGYTVAPVTLDAWDWDFSPVYVDAKKRGDTAMEKRVVDAYLDYSNAMFDYDEKFSKAIIGYEPKQILLLHANELEADHFTDLVELLRKRNYSFITLEDALDDSAYQLPDNYVGEGTGMLDQWAISEGKMPPNEPKFPAWVAALAAKLHQPQP
jgi:peptidoglycan-N-acetylglucosamine deacetylase